MAGFHITVQVTNPNMLEELKERTADLRPLFNAIIQQWTLLNKQKFELSEGQESGADIFGEHWEGLTEPYRTRKRKEGYPDWLMVRTGSLMNSMTNPDLIFQAVNAMDALFGTPLDAEDAAKVAYNWTRRQIVFLGTSDQNMIRQYAQAFLQFGAPFETMMSARTTQTQRDSERISMDMDFKSDIASDTGDWGNG